MLLLENLEGYGLLITLLIQSVWDSMPFLVFSGVWLCVFCVLYKSLGNTPSMEANDGEFPWIHPFFGYFLYAFENFVGNMKSLKYPWWEALIKKTDASTFE